MPPSRSLVCRKDTPLSLHNNMAKPLWKKILCSHSVDKVQLCRGELLSIPASGTSLAVSKFWRLNLAPTLVKEERRETMSTSTVNEKLIIPTRFMATLLIAVSISLLFWVCIILTLRNLLPVITMLMKA